MAKRTCSIERCPNPVVARGWCDNHYRKWRKYGDPLGARTLLSDSACRIESCDGQANEPGSARGLCRKHYLRWKKCGDPEAAAACAGCGASIMVREDAAYCMRRECRRLFRAAQKAKDPEKYRAMQAASRARADKAKRRAAEKRYKARADRKCVRPGCGEFALPGYAYCHPHNKERGARRYARSRLRLPRRLYIRQVGLCPNADHGGCGLPLSDPDGNHVDHLIPEVRNGPQDEWNLQLMHPECNMRKSDSIVPAALIAAAKHGVKLTRPDGKRPRVEAA